MCILKWNRDAGILTELALVLFDLAITMRLADLKFALSLMANISLRSVVSLRKVNLLYLQRGSKSEEAKQRKSVMT